MRYIVIDIGSSFLKSALLDLDTHRIAAQKKLPSPSRQPDKNSNLFEVPAPLYVEIVRGLVDTYTAHYKDIKGILFSTQMHGFVYVSEKRPHTYVSWQDQRCLDPMREDPSISYMDYLRRLFSQEDMKECGVYIKPSLGLCNLFALLDNDPSIPRDGELFTIGSYVISRLTGNNICHLTNAAPLGIANIARRCWDRELLEKVGLGKIRLPELAAYDFVKCGVYCSNGQALAVYPDFGDHQVAILGSMAGSRDALINIATGSQVSVTSDLFQPGEAYEVRPYFERRYIKTISNMPAGRGLDVLVKFIRDVVRRVSGNEVTVPQVWKAIQAGFRQDSRGLGVNMGFYAMPENLDGGSISGITPANFDLDSLFSAAFEDMAGTYWEHIQIIENKNNISRIVCAGGVSWKTPELLRVIRAVTGKECVLSAIPDESLSGLFRIALVCEGICKDLSDKPDLILRVDR